MCKQCDITSAYVRVNEDIVAEVSYDRYDYEFGRDYDEVEIQELVELKVKNLFMTREAFARHISEVIV